VVPHAGLKTWCHMKGIVITIVDMVRICRAMAHRLCPHMSAGVKSALDKLVFDAETLLHMVMNEDDT